MTRKSRGSLFSRAAPVVSVGLVAAAVGRELSLPSDQRTWHGRVAGLVPYDFRRPTVAKLRARMWAMDDPHLLVPHVFGVGWTLNVGRVAKLLRSGLWPHPET